MKKTQLLKIIGELGFVDIRKNGSIQVTPPAINVHHARMEPFVQFLKDYVRVHPRCAFRSYFTLYDAWREHAEPSVSPEFAVLDKLSLGAYVGKGTIGEPGRFIQPCYLSDLFPVFDHPVLAFGRHVNDPFVQLVPDTDFILSSGYEQLKRDIDAHDCDWHHKQSRLFWRGSMHGFPYRAYDPLGKKCQRELLIDWSRQHAAICDARSSHTTPKQEQLQNKFLLDIDGEVNAWSGLFWKLYSNSVVFKVSSHYEQWYYERMTPWTHFIPVRGDFSDLEEKFEWALQNDDECRRIACDGREFAAGLTYQQEVMNIQLSNNTEELYLKHSVVNKMSVALPLRETQVVLHTYRIACDSVTQPPGFGDFLRGSIALFQLSRKYGFELRLDFSQHPLADFLHQHDVIPETGNEMVYEFFNEKNCALEPFLARLQDLQTVFVLTHALPTEPVDDECRSFILKRLQPLAGLKSYLASTQAKLKLNKFCTIHLRLGDHMMKKEAPLPPFVLRWFEDRILPQWGANVLVVSDNSEIKDVLRKNFGVTIIGTNPVHLGQCKVGNVPAENVRDTVAEFLLMAQSQRIYQYSVYPWGSGFSDMCSLLFAIPLEKLSDISEENQTMDKKECVSQRESEHDKRKFLNVGGNNKRTAVPAHYNGWEHVLLDLDLSGEPDLHMDGIDMIELEPGQFDAVYCAQNLEHYFRSDVEIVIQGMHHVLKEDGFAEISVPDFEKLIREAYERKLDIDDTLYDVDIGPVTVHDFIFGYEFTNDPIGRELCLHKTAFTEKSLELVLKLNGFPYVYTANAPGESMEIRMIGFKTKPGILAREVFGIV